MTGPTPARALMSSSGRARVVLCALLIVCVAALARRAAAQGTGAPVDRVPAHDSFTVASHTLGESRMINVHTPAGYATSGDRRYPVLYMPDGGLDEDFPHVVNTVDSLIGLGEIRPVIVVGVPNTERRRDLTGPTRLASDSAIATHVGGSAAFRSFLRDELMPAIGKRYRVTAERSIVGESLAGLFIVETLLEHPAMFDHYVAIDPSVWWNGGALVNSAPAQLARFDAAPRTLFLASSKDDIDASTERLAAQIRAHLPRGLVWEYAKRPDLAHGTIFRAVGPLALARALK